MNRRTEVTRALILFSVAAVLRLAAASVFGSPIRPQTDAVQYDALARAFLNGEWLTTPLVIREPGYSVFLAFGYALPGPELMVRHVLQTILGACVPVLVYLGLGGLLRERVRLLAAVAVVGNLHLLYYTALPLRENLVTFLLALTLVAFLHAFRSRRTRTLLGGTLCLSLLVHTDARFLPLALGLPIFGRLARGSWPWRSTIVVGSLTALLLVPYTVRNRLATGEVVVLTERAVDKWIPRALGEADGPLAGGRAGWLANWERVKFTGRDEMSPEERAAFDAGVRPATGRLETFATRWIEYWRFARFTPAYRAYPDGRFAPAWSARHDLSSALTLVPLLAFLPFFLRGTTLEERRTLLAIGAFVASHALLHVLVHARERYRVPVEPWIAVLAASGAAGLLSPWLSRFARRLGPTSATVSRSA